MREIRFRGWYPHHKCMMEPEFHGPINEIFNNQEDWNKVIYMQYTGLKDKNGREIYEGDIVKVPVDLNTGLHGEHAYYEIKYHNGLWIVSYLSSEKGFILPRGYLVGELIDYARDLRKSLVFNDHEATFENLEVIGNIYEHKHLLEETA